MYLRIKKYRLSIHIVTVMFSIAIIDKIVIEVQWQRVKYFLLFLTAKNRRLYLYHLCCYFFLLLFSENSDVVTGKALFCVVTKSV